MWCDRGCIICNGINYNEEQLESGNSYVFQYSFGVGVNVGGSNVASADFARGAAYA